LEGLREVFLAAKATKIQKVFRMHLRRKVFKRLKAVALIVQKNRRKELGRRGFLQKKKAANRIRAFMLAYFAKKSFKSKVTSSLVQI